MKSRARRAIRFLAVMSSLPVARDLNYFPRSVIAWSGQKVIFPLIYSHMSSADSGAHCWLVNEMAVKNEVEVVEVKS